jgi:hypothetical protein
MLRERPGGKARLAAGVQGQVNTPGVVDLPRTGLEKALFVNAAGGVKSEQQGIGNKMLRIVKSR